MVDDRVRHADLHFLREILNGEHTVNDKIRFRNGTVSGRIVSVCVAAAFAAVGTATVPAQAATSVPHACRTIRLASASWVDNEVQNAVFSTIVAHLGYSVKSNTYSVPIIYAGLKNRQLDVFLDNWMPAQKTMRQRYLKQKAINVMGPDLTGAKYTLAVPAYLYKEGLKTFSDIHKFGKQLHYKIYGIESGAAGNVSIQKMIKDNKFDLGKFHLVQSSSAGMLAEVKRLYQHQKPIVFLAWEPHPMNIEFKIKYLTGGAKYFGPHQGAATIYIITRRGYAKDCPNVGALLNNFRLSVDAENKMMYQIQVKKEKPDAVAKKFLSAHPDWIRHTLAGVTTTDGKKGAPVVLKAMGQG